MHNTYDSYRIEILRPLIKSVKVISRDNIMNNDENRKKKTNELCNILHVLHKRLIHLGIVKMNC